MIKKKELDVFNQLVELKNSWPGLEIYLVINRVATIFSGSSFTYFLSKFMGSNESKIESLKQ